MTESKYKKSGTDMFVPLLGVLLLVLSAFLFFTGYEISDDGVVEGRLVSVLSRVEGSVVNVYIEDGQEVKKGDLLMEIDPNVYQLKLREVESQLNNARVKLLLCEKPERENPIIISDDNKPSKSLIDSKYVFSKSDLDKFARAFAGNVQKRKDATSLKNFIKDEKKEREALEMQDPKNIATSQVNQKIGEEEQEEEYEMIDTVELRAYIKQLEAQVSDCKLNLSYTKVYATQDGTISSRNVKVGDVVEVGQELFNLVPKRVWVVANYKSSQTSHMHEGQKVYIKIEDYPGRFFKGMVESVDAFDGVAKMDGVKNQPAVNSDFVPVRIVFTKDYSEYNLVPGMAVSSYVKVK